MKPIVICSGMVRSGSTWSYNVARIIMQIKFGEVGIGYANFEDIDQIVADQTGPAVIKAHYPSKYVLMDIFDQKLQNIFTVRDPRDCFASRRDFQADESEETALNFVLNSQRYFEAFIMNQHSTLFVKYENLKSQPLKEIQRVGHYLGLSMTVRDAANIHDNTSPEAVKKLIASFDSMDSVSEAHGHKIDSFTQLHGNHITDGRVDRWKDADISDKMMQPLTEFARVLGYEPQESV